MSLHLKPQCFVCLSISVVQLIFLSEKEYKSAPDLDVPVGKKFEFYEYLPSEESI